MTDLHTVARRPMEVAALVPMPRLLEALNIPVDKRTRRCRCVVHGGKNPTAFSWREDGLWYCHACGAGGDRITLVRVIRSCSFREAIKFLAEIAGVAYVPYQFSSQEIERAKARRDRIESAAWKIRDEVSRLRQYYRDALHRCDRLWCCLGEDLIGADSEIQRGVVWEQMRRLAITATFFLAAYKFFCSSDTHQLTRFAVSTPEQRRILILGEININETTNGTIPSGSRN